MLISERSDRDFNVILESWLEPGETVEETLRTEDEWVREGIRILKEVVRP